VLAHGRLGRPLQLAVRADHRAREGALRPRARGAIAMTQHAPLGRKVRAVTAAAYVPESKVRIPDVLGYVLNVRRVPRREVVAAGPRLRAFGTLATSPLAEALHARRHGLAREVRTQVRLHGGEIEREELGTAVVQAFDYGPFVQNLMSVE
jgi:hypothetical protein